MPEILVVALATPLRRLFEYLPAAEPNPRPLEGCRVLVPFGPQKLVGVVVAINTEATYPLAKLRPIIACLDDQPLLPPDILSLCQWASDYYHHPLGEVIHGALPIQLRKADGQLAQGHNANWTHTTAGLGLPSDALKRSRKQQALHQLLLQHKSLPESVIKAQGISASVIRALADKGLIEKIAVAATAATTLTSALLAQEPQTLNPEQVAAFEQLRYHRYQTYLLEGTTGSGKTEVYLHAIARALQAGKQALVLVPEIGLAPQTLQRFSRRFNVPIVQLHSNVAAGARASNWQAARDGQARIVIGTRLAALTPMPDLGIIIIDEEHDLSFKQQDGWRYSARDLAVMRAYRAQIPLLLGSATPSLESLYNASAQRYQHLRLTQRAGDAQTPQLNVVDMRKEPAGAPFAAQTVQAIGDTLNRGEQVLVFINRRGYAPALLCQHCGWSANCSACDARLTLHNFPRHLRCHHCDQQKPVPSQCPSCRNPELHTQGQGTERVEILLRELFGATEILRVDQDSMQRKSAMHDLTERMAEATPCILVGTQMLAKGHHFPRVTLAVLLDIDQGLFSGDFRGPERMGQQIVQVSGRAGRGALAGSVILQTHQPDHPLLQLLLQRGYGPFARQLLAERATTRLPPVWHMALFRAESKRAQNALDFLKLALQEARLCMPPSPQVQYVGPLPSLLERRNDRFRYQLQIVCAQRKDLQHLLKTLLAQIEGHALASRTRWSLDVDPQDMS